MKSESGVGTMLRLTAILCAALYVTFLVGGEDRGQKRMGLIEGELEAAQIAMAQAAAQDQAARAVASAVAPEAQPSRTIQTNRDAQVISVAFAATEPVVTPVLQPVAVTQSDVSAQATIVDAVFTEDSAETVMYVTGRSVNVRSGPSTSDDVLARLTRGEAVTIVALQDNGWAQIRIEGDGVEGFMSLDFLTESSLQ